MFSPPSHDAAGIVQFQQYVRWIESVLDVELLPLDDDIEYRRPQQTAAIRHICDRLRDGETLHRLLSMMRRGSDDTAARRTTRRQDLNKVEKKIPSSQAVKHLLAARDLFINLVLADDVLEGAASSGIHRAHRIHSEQDVPQAAQWYAGNYDTLSCILFHTFHVSVVRDRMMLLPSMLRWFSAVMGEYASVHSGLLEYFSPSVDGSNLDACFANGTAWILAMHNMTEDVSIDLSTVYLQPTTRAEIAANVSFAYCLFELHNVFTYFTTLSDFLERRNSHFMFMQCFHLYQHFDGREPRLIDGASLRFAVSRGVALKETTQTSNIKIADVTRTTGQVSNKARPSKYAATKSYAVQPHSNRLSKEQISDEPNIIAVEAVVPHEAAVKEVAHPTVSYLCKMVFCPPSSSSSGLTVVETEVSLERSDMSIRLQSPSVDHRDAGGAFLYRIPVNTLDRCRCDAKSSVLLECKTRVPSAPPPYHLSQSPALTLFFDDVTAAKQFAATLANAIIGLC